MAGRVVFGEERVLRALKKMKDGDAVKIQDGLTRCAHIILRASLKLVPRASGDLAATGRVEVSGSGMGTRAVVGYGGPAPSGNYVDYAAAVHEILTAAHAPPTRAKYLTAAVNATRGTCTALLKRQLGVSRTEPFDPAA